MAAITPRQGLDLSTPDSLSRANLPTFIGSIIGIIMPILGVLLLAYLIYGGYIWLIAQGDDARVKKAKDIIKNAVIGLVIVFAAWAVADYVVRRIQGAATGQSNAYIITQDKNS